MQKALNSMVEQEWVMLNEYGFIIGGIIIILIIFVIFGYIKTSTCQNNEQAISMEIKA
jgi:hypothetical protein